jgi:hypothetical protein
MFTLRLKHASFLQENAPQPFRILSACFAIRHDLDVLRPGFAKAEFDGTQEFMPVRTSP